MSDQDMIIAILNSIQIDTNLFMLLRAMIANNINNVPSANLQAMCALLGISTV